MRRWTAVILAVLAGLVVLFIGASVMLVAGGDTTTGTEQSAGAVATTSPATVAAVFDVFTPSPGDVVSSPLLIEGIASGSRIDYRLIGGGGTVLAEGVTAPDGAGESTFSVVIEFTNLCCDEMALLLTTDEGLGLEIPLGFGEGR